MSSVIKDYNLYQFIKNIGQSSREKLEICSTYGKPLENTLIFDKNLI
jgi:hypothetical protein